ncbi:NAD(P)H-dependent oxidoreductase [Persicobacter diffluens]|uniref:NAD(P)-dependent oxidoreductase n=1 Tax=Persicobacter diffluens TaxID=981 RepID=A0AAN5AM80_9BACT|nr:NAD(P)-dependent oxidoreductase [Persicobacter diffluens]
MILIDKALQKRQKEGNPIRVGIVGVGAMGAGIINQIMLHTSGMEVNAIYNRHPEKGLNILSKIGASLNNILDDDRQRFREGHIRLTGNLEVFLETPNDIVVEATGSISFGLQLCKSAFEYGKHVLSFNAELDATFGPYLKKLAKSKGVIYSGSDGDQPGVIMNLYRYVKNIGLKPLVCGNIKGLQDRYRNPATQQQYAATYGLSPEMATSFADGTKISFEQATVANATGMRVNKRGMNGFSFHGHIDKAVDFYDFNELRKGDGIVDYFVGAQPAPGVFVYAYSEDPLVKHHLNYYKLGHGPIYSFYTPYHLCIFEVPISICRIVDFEDIIIEPKSGISVEVITMAKTALFEGTVLDGIGGYHTYGVCENSELARLGKLLPMGLAQGCRLIRDISQDQPILISDVEVLDEDLFNTYELQFSLNIVGG